MRVAVWDMDSMFPALDRTLETMNGSQMRFGFELVTLSTPLDVWDVNQKAEDGTPYLWAEKLARRLERFTVEFRVNILACITRHWLRDDDWLNLYGWWPANKKPPVVIFSCAGFPELAAEGPDADRTIANATVSAIAGMLADLGAHEGGAKNCPLYSNEDRDFELLSGSQSFDKRCHAKLKKKIPQELAALEALLKTFDESR